MHEAHFAPNNFLDTYPRTRALHESDTPEEAKPWDGIGLVRRSSCLPFQLFWIETLSFLPNGQNNRRNLARDGQTGHRWPHPRGQQGSIEISEWAGRSAGPRGGALEQRFQLMIVILIETAQGWLSLRALELAAGHAIFPAGSSLQGQATIGPELPFGPETVRYLNQGNQEGNPDRAQLRDLAQHAVRRMFVALRQHLPRASRRNGCRSSSC